MKKSWLFGLLVIVTLLSACVAPTAPAAPSAAPPAGEAAPTQEAAPAPPAAEEQKPVVVALGTIADQLDPMFSSSLNDASIFNQLFDVLIGMNENVELVPAVATKWQVAEDGLTWTFSLRDDVTFWDGSKLTAADVKYTIDRMTDPAIGTTGNTQWLANNMDVDHTEVVDDSTAVIVTKVPVPALPYFIHEINLMSKAHYENLSVEEAAKSPLGSGPYTFVEFVKDDHLTIAANPNWWGGEPEIKTVVWRKIPEASTRVAELTTGGVDLAQGIPTAKFDEVQNLPNARLESVTGGCRMFIGFTHANPNFQDKRVRQALNYAVDWDLINQSIYKGMAPRMAVNVNPPWLNENLKPYAYDPDKAKALLADAGWTDSDGDGVFDKDGQPFMPNVLVYYSPTSAGYEVITAIVGMYQDIGVNAQIEAYEFSVAIDKLINHEFKDMFIMASCSTFEGQGDISDLEANSISNYGGWVNEDFQALFEQLRQEFDFAKRKQILDEMEVIVYEEAPIVFLTQLVDTWGVSDRVDWRPHPAGRVHLEHSHFVK